MRPILIEAMTYRIGHHSTSDDSSAYRSVDEVRIWNQKDNPITRLKKYLESKNWWDDNKEKDLRIETKQQVMNSFVKAEKLLKPNYIRGLFDDVYDEMPKHLVEQSEDLKKHIEEYKEHYPLNDYKA